MEAGTPRFPRPAGGFSILEAVLVILLISILGIIAVPFIPRVDESTLESQAQKFASDIRRTQTIAMSTRRTLCVVNTASVYQITTFTSPAGCGSTAITDPTTNQAFAVQLLNGATLSGGGPLVINSLGRALTGATYVLSLPTSTRSVEVEVAPLTAYVTVGP